MKGSFYENWNRKKGIKYSRKICIAKRKNPTVRSIAKETKVSKSTVHKDMTERLKECNRLLYNEVEEIFKKNNSEKHIRGGESTKQKYLRK